MLENALLRKFTICGCKKKNINNEKTAIKTKRAGIILVILLL
jgi:hypothetical protein